MNKSEQELSDLLEANHYTCRTLTIDLAHIPEGTNDALLDEFSAMNPKPGLAYEKLRHGWLIYISSSKPPDDLGPHVDLERLIGLTFQFGYRQLILHRYAPELPRQAGFVRFNW